MLPLQGIYIGCTIFSVGITALDFLGLLSRGTHDSDNVDDSHGSHEIGGSHDSSNHSADDGYGNSHHGHSSADHSDHSHHSHESSDAASHHGHHGGGTAVLSMLVFLRSLVYFCLGFGPTGWVALAGGGSYLTSLFWSLPVGMVTLTLARFFFRFQRSDTDSSLSREDLLFHRGAVVIVPLSHHKMGKIRVKVGMNVDERFALAAKPDVQFKKGDRVWITDVADECVYVEKDVFGKE